MVRRVVGPVRGVDAPVVAAVVWGHGEAAEEHELAAGGAERRDARVRVPFVGVRRDVVGVQGRGELVVGAGAGALALEGEEDGFGGGRGRGPAGLWLCRLVGVGWVARKARRASRSGRKGLAPVRAMGKTPCTRRRDEEVGSCGCSRCRRRSRKRMPWWSWVRIGETWQRTEGRPRWWVGELWVPGMERPERGMVSGRCCIHEERFVVWRMERWVSSGINMPMK